MHPVVNVLQLKVYLGSIVSPPHPIELDSALEYEMAAILSHHTAGWQKNCEYLVKFVGYTDSSNEWLPESNFEHANDLLLHVMLHMVCEMGGGYVSQLSVFVLLWVMLVTALALSLSWNLVA